MEVKFVTLYRYNQNLFTEVTMLLNQIEQIVEERNGIINSQVSLSLFFIDAIFARVQKDRSFPVVLRRFQNKQD